MPYTVEEQKALKYLQDERKREAFQRSLQARLTAPAEPAATTKKNWAPLTSSGRIKGQNE